MRNMVRFFKVGLPSVPDSGEGLVRAGGDSTNKIFVSYLVACIRII